jgi:hypothetical protein
MARISTLLVVACLAAPQAQASDGFPSVKFSGFASIVGGKIANDPLPGYSPDPALTAPIYIADWSNWGTYSKSFSFKPESRAGAQAVVSFTEDLRFTGQVVVRTVDPGLDLTWAYLSYNLTPDFEIQVGRKRIPLYYYSDFQDIGLSYPWVSTPPEVYGWDATNYNGASLRYKTSLGGASLSASLFGGKETVKESRYMHSAGQTKTDVNWNDIRGGDLEVTKGWLTLRGVYLSANPEYNDRLDPANNYKQKMTAYGLAANADFGEVFVLTEFAQNNRTTEGFETKAPCYTAGVGYRIGKWTPFLNFSVYKEITTDPSYAPVNYKRPSLTLRYDLTSNSAIKVQLDRYLEFNNTAYTTDSTVFRISFDVVF